MASSEAPDLPFDASSHAYKKSGNKKHLQFLTSGAACSCNRTLLNCIHQVCFLPLSSIPTNHNMALLRNVDFSTHSPRMYKLKTFYLRAFHKSSNRSRENITFSKFSVWASTSECNKTKVHLQSRSFFVASNVPRVCNAAPAKHLQRSLKAAQSVLMTCTNPRHTLENWTRLDACPT